MLMFGGERLVVGLAMPSEKTGSKTLNANSILIAESQKDCEGNIPSRLEFGGSVAFEEDCVWRPQVHFISALSGKVSQPNRSLKAPIISLNTSLPLPSSTSGPSKLVVNNVVLVNFTLSNPTKPSNPVLWPAGLLQPGWQAGTTLPRKLYLLDVRIFVQAESLQQYLQFFRYNSSATFYTDNATFLHVNYWNDERTLLQNVGLLLDVPGMSPLDMLGTKPAPGRNFVLGADTATLVPLLRGVAGVSTRVPFLVYLSSNVSLTARTGVGAGLPVNRQLFVVGKLTDITSIDFGMEVNQLVLAGSWSNITFSRVVLENLGPGDNRSAAISHNHDVQAGYNIWPVLFKRSARRLSLNNVTLVLSHLDVEEFLYKATLYQIRPAGFTQQLQVLDSMVMAWRVTWQPTSVGMLIMTPLLLTTSMSVLDTNYTTQPVIAPQVPLPTRYTVASSEASLQQALVQVNDWGLEGLGAAATGSQSELVLITTNLSFEGVSAPAAPGNQSPEQQLLEHLERNMQAIRAMRHILMGIVQPPVMLDMAYAVDLVRFPPGMPTGQLLIVSLTMNHLPQGPRASLPTASMLTADVWTILLWCFARPPDSVIQMSNVTLWLPAGEFSLIRSHTKDTPVDFDVGLEGGVVMSFAGVVDLRADGLYVSLFKGPGIAGNSLTLRMELGWSMNGPPKGFWTTPASAAPAGGRLSDAMVTVLAVCLVTAFVASMLACLAIVFWRKRAAEARAAAAAAAELGKAGLAHTSSTGRDVDSSGEGGNSDGAGPTRHRARSDLGMLSLLHMAPEVLEGPVHDSSNSYHHDRAALTHELARSQFGVTQLSGGDVQPAEEGSGSHVAGLGRAAAHGRPLLPPAASVPGFSTTSMASDAALHRLQSAITSMSQDVLSRRLAGAYGKGPSIMSTLGKTSLPEALMHRGGGDAANADSAGAHQQAQEGAGTVDSPHALSAGNAGGPVPAAGAWTGALARAAAAADNHDGLALGSGGARGFTAGKAAPAAPAQNHSVSSGSNPSGDDGLDQLKLLQLVGQGTFGQVYKALWRRRCVAVKVLQLPATAGSSDMAPWMGVGRASSHREKMAVMETVLRLVMEFCDAGSLRTALDQKLLIDRTTGLPALECVLFLAHDVACAMIHLHSEHLLHGDLKASNVLLKRTAPRLPVAPEAAGAANRNKAGQLAGLGLGLMAKVADFGLSLTLGPAETHVSQMHMGTLTHMAPELLLHGRASKASDVYAYGILLWELATGRRPYSGTPVGMLAHKVAQQGWRPAWPGGASLPVRQLVEACWAQEAADRPCFNDVVQRLEAMASELDQLKQQQAQQMAAAAAPVCALGASGNHLELELGHELTPSMMEDLMPSGFSAGSNHSGLSAQGEELQLEDSGILYEMSQLSGGSQAEQGPVDPL
eukprot:gene4405-4658_t